MFLSRTSVRPASPDAQDISKPLVEVRDLTVKIVSKYQNLSLLNGVTFTLKEGEVLCFLGESGSGKSLTMRSLMRLLPETAQLGGSISVAGIDVLALKRKELVGIRGPLMSMIFQEPATALDPIYTIGDQIAETVRIHEHISKDGARRRALELLDLVQIPSARQRLNAYPHELSGGLRQRAMIALALSCRPKLLLADEPTTALDATVQIQVLLLLRKLQKELGLAIIFVTHDVGVACEIADRIGVMYAGRIVEMGPVGDVIATPAHPYTTGLLHSMVSEQVQGGKLTPIPGEPPNLQALPPGCSFAPRCSLAHDACTAAVPDFARIAPDHSARCVLAAERA